MEQKRVDIARLALSPPSPLACTGQRTNRERGLRPAAVHVKARSAGTYPTVPKCRGDRSRDGHCWPPPPRIPAYGTTVPGSCLASNDDWRTAPADGSPYPPPRNDTMTRPRVRCVALDGEFRLASRLPSSLSATRLRALFETFLGTTQLCDFPGSCISGVRLSTSRCAPAPALLRVRLEKPGISRFSCEVFPCMRGVSDPVGSLSNSRSCWAGCCLPHKETASAPHSG